MTEENQYKECYQFCLKQGWVHNTPEIDVVNDYFDSTKGRKNLFDNHLKKIDETKELKDIHILIGEAPPYYPNNKYPKTENRKFFYDEGQSEVTGYFIWPCKHFLEISDWKEEKRSKKELLGCLANKGVLIFDIFPFPIFQSTDIREKVVWGTTDLDENAVSTFYSSKQSKFDEYLENHFRPRFKCLLDSFEGKKIHIYMFAPKLASIQFLNWFILTQWKDHLVKFNGDFIFHESVKNEKTNKEQKFINSSLKNFVLQLTGEENKSNVFIEDVLKKHPIFMNGSGNPDFKNFVNGKRNEK
jgi:hypothetical protein